MPCEYRLRVCFLVMPLESWPCLHSCISLSCPKITLREINWKTDLGERIPNGEKCPTLSLRLYLTIVLWESKSYPAECLCSFLTHYCLIFRDTYQYGGTGDQPCSSDGRDTSYSRGNTGDEQHNWGANVEVLAGIALSNERLVIWTNPLTSDLH